VAVLRLRARRLCELIQQRERLVALEAGNCKHDGEAIGRKTEATIPAPLPAQETLSSANPGTGNGIVAQNPSPAAQQDPVYQRWESIGKARSWAGEPSWAVKEQEAVATDRAVG